jgi:hypothetical protein
LNREQQLKTKQDETVNLVRDCQDPIVLQVCQKLLGRSVLGTTKYGTTLENNKVGMIEWFNHLQEEMLDGANYAQKMKVILQRELSE